LAIVIDGANRHDMKLVRKTLEELKLERPQLTAWWPQHLCLDKGYDYIEVLELVTAFGWTAHIRSRGEEAEDLRRTAGYRARRWVVERTHSWLNRCRGLLVRWARKAKNYLAFLHLACGIISWRATGLLG
jgi:putative transposase